MQDFKATRTHERWVADFSYIATLEAGVLDLFSRRVVGFAMHEMMTVNLALWAREAALLHRKPHAESIPHSDRGTQSTSEQFQKMLHKHKIICSMTGGGHCYDNAAAESFFHTLKTEHVFFEPYETREAAKKNIFEYIEVFYNKKRRHSPISHQGILKGEWMRICKTLSGVSTKELQAHYSFRRYSRPIAS